MGVNQSDRQASVRAVTGTAWTYEGDWSALFDSASIPAGSFNGRLLAWINSTMSASYTELNGAMQAYAVSQGAASWNELGTFTPVHVPSGFAYITGDRTSQITVTATAGLMAGTLSQLVNGNTADTGVYFNAVAVAGKRVVFYFNGATAYIDEATMYTILGGGAGLGTWKWRGSNDGVGWTDIGGSFVLSSTPNTFPMASMNGNLTGWKYYAIEGVSGTASAAPWVSEFQFRQGS